MCILYIYVHIYYIEAYVIYEKTCVNCLSIHVSICSVNKTYNDCQLFFPKDIYLFLLCCLCLYLYTTLWSILKRLYGVYVVIYIYQTFYIYERSNGQVINWLDLRNKKKSFGFYRNI